MFFQNTTILVISKILNTLGRFFFSLKHEKRVEKHISSPNKGSSCKRLHMFLRWMVRNIKFSAKHKFSFPYLIDETQEIAKKYDAVCTPDFFGYNKDLKLNYRGRIRELRDLKPIRNGTSELFEAMKLISETQKGPDIQKPSLGCSIKWFKK